MFTDFAKATAERAVKTFAQTMLALLGAGAIDLTHVDWVTDLKIAGGAALISVLTSIASSAVTTTPGPSLTKAEQLVDPAPKHAAP